MRLRRRRGRREPSVSVVVPAYDVAAYLPACLDSVLAQGDDVREVVVVDDGSPDASGEIAEAYARSDPRVRVVHTANRGLGAARNEGLRHVTGEVLAFADSDDVVPPGSYDAMLRQLRRTGADLVTGSIARWEADGRLVEPRWMRRLHPRAAYVIEQQPELLGDVFAWNKLYRRRFWDAERLSWPEGTRYEDQPTLTRAYLAARRIGVVPDVVYHWRIRADGTSITQQRSSLADLRDRVETKRDSLEAVLAHGSTPVTTVFRDKVLAGDLHRYFTEIPGSDDDWYGLLEAGVREFWGTRRSLTHSILPPVHRLTGWLVEQGRRDDAAAVMTYVAGLEGRPAPRVTDGRGERLDLPLTLRGLDRRALEVRPGE